jgi:hypothetical protein
LLNKLHYIFEAGAPQSPAKPLQDYIVLKEIVADCRRWVKRILDHFRVQADGSLIDNDDDPDSTALKEWSFQFTAEGREYWHYLYKALDDELDSTSGIRKAIISRSHPTIMRLAIIYAALDRKSEIGKEHLESAKAFWDYSARSALWAFGDNSGNRDADDILKALRQRGEDGMTSTEITRLVFGNRDTFKRDAALATLKQQGRIVMLTEKGANNKPVTRWFAEEFSEE